jgi:hypothetical protein
VGKINKEVKEILDEAERLGLSRNKVKGRRKRDDQPIWGSSIFRAFS